MKRLLRALALVSLCSTMACTNDLFTPARDASSSFPDATLLDAGGLDAGALDASEVTADGGTAADAELADAEATDLGGAEDAAALDSGAPDAGFLDATVPDSGACAPGDLGDPDRPRIMLLGQPYDATGSHGTEIRSLSIGSNGRLVDDGMRLDVGTRPSRIAFVPDGSRALVLGDDGRLVSVRVDAVDALSVIGHVGLPGADYGDIVITSDGFTAYVVGSNVDQTSGISTVHIGCQGELTVETSQFYNIRLSSSLALFPGEDRAVLLGGQTVFDPVDPLDVRLLSHGPNGWSPIESFDIYTDFIDAGNIALSPDGSTLLIPNGSPFSNEGSALSVCHVAGDVITEVSRIQNLEDIRQVMFSPDGATALASLLEPGRVVVLADRGAGLAVQQTVRGIGLAEDMAMIRRGSLSGWVYVPSIDASGGPNVAYLQIDAPGHVVDRGQFELGSGSEQIPGAVAVTP